MVAIPALFSFTLLVATIAWAGWFLFGGKSVRKKARKWLLRVLCRFPPRTRDGAINKVLVEFGYTQAGLTRYGGWVVLGFLYVIVIVTPLPFLFGWAIPHLGRVPTVEGKFLVTPIVAGLIGVSTLVFGLRQWQKARSEISLDKFYERLAETNDKRVKWWTAPRQHGRLDVRDYRTRMYIHLELDNLEYSIQKYQIGWMSRENAYTTLRTFCQRCLESKFREAAQGLVESNIGYHDQTRWVVQQVHDWATTPPSPSVWYEKKGLIKCMKTIDCGWNDALEKAIAAARDLEIEAAKAEAAKAEAARALETAPPGNGD